jgi:methyltransferase (TIGR00027 family)
MSTLAKVSTTAVGVALIRARESEREDRLLNDPYARAFGDAARASYHEAPETWAMVEQLVDGFYEGRIVGVRVFDDLVRDAVDAGLTQIVLLGAGLDTRAFRLDLPADVRLFEVDVPEMIAFKEPILRELGAEPTCGRTVVAADLREDWSSQLTEAGFHRDVPTLWLEEGVLGYLPREQARAVLTTVTGLTAAGSRFIAGALKVDESAEHYRKLKEFVGSAAQPSRGLGPDPATWLREIGWATEFRAWDDLAAPLGRGVATGDPDNGLVLATRHQER